MNATSAQNRLMRVLTREGIDERVVRAMAAVPRSEFVPEDERAQAYEDTALPIGYEQTISQPYIVGFMTEKLELLPADRVLEIGTGSGYQAAVLSRLVAQVYSIEIVPELAAQAAQRLQRLGFDNVKLRVGDGSFGWPEEAPFDAIIATCAPGHVPQRLIAQLTEGGRMILPVGLRVRRQELYVLRKHGGSVHTTPVLQVRFVPMTGAVQDDDV